MKLTQFTDYSLRALMFMALQPDKKLCTVKEIASHFDISYNHMVKVAHNLSVHGYIVSRKGKGGGIFLAMPAEEINLGDVICALEPDFDLVECFNSKGACKIAPICKLKNILSDASEAFITELKKYTLADLTVEKDAFFELLG